MSIISLPRRTVSVPVPPLPRAVVLPLLLAMILALTYPLGVTIPATAPSPVTPTIPYARTDSNVFIENRGQFAPHIIALLVGQQARLAVSQDGQLHLHVAGAPPLTLTLTAAGAQLPPPVHLYGPLATTVSFLTGSDPDRWQANVPVWEGVRIELAPGITLALRVSDGRLRVRAITPDPGLLAGVRMQVSGGQVIGVTGDGLAVEAGDHRLILPLLEAVTPAGIPHRQPPTPTIEADSIVLAPVGTPVGSDEQPQTPHTPTRVAMLLGASTFLGRGISNGNDRANAITIDEQGTIYVAGETASTDFPTTSKVYDESFNDAEDETDAFVSRLSSDLTTLLASTFLGGNRGESISALTHDAQGNIYVTGTTRSSDFPTTIFDKSFNGVSDVFVSRLNRDLTTLQPSTLLGGSDADEATALALDDQGNVYVAGTTRSGDFPTTAKAYAASLNGEADAFVSRLSGDLTTLSASTLLGGSAKDNATALALDDQGTVYVAGTTWSDNFPTTAKAYAASLNGEADAFVSRLSGDLTTLSASTLLGGSAKDDATALALDSRGIVYVAGKASSTNFPITSTAYVRSFNGKTDAFVSRLNGELTTLHASIVIGGSDEDYVTALTLDAQGTVYVTGETSSSDFPITPWVYDASFNGGSVDTFVSRLSGDLTTLRASTLLGGSGSDRAAALAVDAQGTVYVVGETSSADFPTTPGAYDTSFNGGSHDAFISRLSGNLTTLQASTVLGGLSASVEEVLWEREKAYAIAAAGQGTFYVAGVTSYADFPTTPGVYDAMYNGNTRDYYLQRDVFVSWMSSDLTTILASTFLGGNGDDIPNDLAVDAQGTVYVAGETSSDNFPTSPGAYDVSFNPIESDFYVASDAFVIRLSSDLTTLLDSTFLGEEDSESANALALDTEGNVYVTGWTNSRNFPTTPRAYDTSCNDKDAHYLGDVFVSRLSSDLSTLLASTFLGGDGGESATALALDTEGNVYVTGYTESRNFPTTPGAYDRTFNSISDSSHDHKSDVFVSRLSGDLTTLLASTFLGGDERESATALALNTEGNVYVTGPTASRNFPTTHGAYDRSFNSIDYPHDGYDYDYDNYRNFNENNDVFVSWISGDLTTLLASTFFGGKGNDSVTTLAIDAQGDIYIAGETVSDNFPLTARAYDRSFNGKKDAFVSWLSGDLARLRASTLLGGTDKDSASTLALDEQGIVYVAGFTTSADFPTTPDAYDTTFDGEADAFVSRLNSDLTTLLASTVLGGSFSWTPLAESARSIVTDNQGTVYVAGYTWAADFPTTPGAYDVSYNGNYARGGDVFVSRLNGDLTSILTSTFLGGSNNDTASALALDAQGSIYIVGETNSADFPTTPGAYDTTFDGEADAFVSRLSSDLTTLLASTLLGGNSSFDTAAALVLDAQGTVYVTGTTNSTDFPTTPGAYDALLNDDYDAFVSRLSGDLTMLLASTFLGGNGGYNKATALALDNQGTVYVAGETMSDKFPTTPGAYDESFNGGNLPLGGDIFMCRLSDDLTTLLASTFFGGDHNDVVSDLAVDAQGTVYITGGTLSPDFPTTPGAYDESFNGGNSIFGGDTFVSRLSGDLTTLLASTFLGGGKEDVASDLALDTQGAIYIVGKTYSPDFPTTAKGYNTSFNGYSDAFVSRLSGDLTILLTSTFLGGRDGEGANTLVLDGEGTIYVAGETSSADFPITPGAYDTSLIGLSYPDIFVSRLVFTFPKISPIHNATNQPTWLTLQWQSAGATVHHYRYCLATTPGCVPDTQTGISTRVVVTHLTPDTTYYWQVRACADGDCAVFIDADAGMYATFTTASRPTAFSKTSPPPNATNQPTSLTLQWQSDGSTVHHYRYCLATTPGCSPNTPAGAKTSTTVYNLTPGATYHWQVRACANSTCSVYADADHNEYASFTVAPAASVAFSKTSPAPNAINQPSSVTLQWQSAGTTVHHYRYCLATIPGCQPTHHVGTHTSVTVSELSPDRTYFWQVRACTDSECTDYSDADNGRYFSFNVGDARPIWPPALRQASRRTRYVPSSHTLVQTTHRREV